MEPSERGNGSPAIVWNEWMEVGDAVLDSQHRHIVDLINALHAAAEGDGLATAETVLHHVVRFMQHHFDAEEAILRKIGDPEVDKHAAEHRRLMVRIAEAAQSAQDEYQVGEDGLGETVLSWIHEHTLSWDQRSSQMLRMKSIPESG
jgi:hemerythrin